MQFSLDELSSKIKDLEPWRHDIDLGNGIRTRTDNNPAYDPAIKWDSVIGKLFPKNMTGMTVLDVGCNTGYNGVQCKLRGAERVVGVEYARKNVEQAKFISEYFHAPLEIIEKDVLEFVLTTNEQFDYVLFSRVFYHLKYPNLVLDRLSQMTKKGLENISSTVIELAETEKLQAHANAVKIRLKK